MPDPAVLRGCSTDRNCHEHPHCNPPPRYRSDTEALCQTPPPPDPTSRQVSQKPSAPGGPKGVVHEAAPPMTTNTFRPLATSPKSECSAGDSTSASSVSPNTPGVPASDGAPSSKPSRRTKKKDAGEHGQSPWDYASHVPVTSGRGHPLDDGTPVSGRRSNEPATEEASPSKADGKAVPGLHDVPSLEGRSGSSRRLKEKDRDGNSSARSHASAARGDSLRKSVDSLIDNSRPPLEPGPAPLERPSSSMGTRRSKDAGAREGSAKPPGEGARSLRKASGDGVVNRPSGAAAPEPLEPPLSGGRRREKSKAKKDAEAEAARDGEGKPPKEKGKEKGKEGQPSPREPQPSPRDDAPPVHLVRPPSAKGSFRGGAVVPPLALDG